MPIGRVTKCDTLKVCLLTGGRKELTLPGFPERVWAVLHSYQRGAVGHVALTFRVWYEDDAWQAICPELGVPSFGDAPGAALDAVLDATLGYLNEIERNGERRRVFRERGLKLLKGTPARKADEVEERMAADQAVSRLDIGLGAAAVA
jgi:hypothetical protein